MGSLAVIEHFFLLIGAKDVLGAEAPLRAWPCAAHCIDIVIVAYLVEVAALQAIKTTVHGCRLHLIEVLVQLHHAQRAVAAGHVNRTVLVHEHARVIVSLTQTGHLPLSLGVGGGEQVAAAIVTIAESVEHDIELSVLVEQAVGPVSLGVDVLVALQVILGVGRHLLQWVGAILPVHQIL